MKDISIYDTTLRDGSQGEGVAFSMEDKILIARRLDALGIHYIEGGWPGSNPKDIRFFRQIQDARLKHAKVAAFGSTRRPGVAPESDSNLQALVDAATPVVTIFGKSWDFHVTEALETTLEENLAMIRDSVGFLRRHFEQVIYDAEHFFDGFKKNRAYALRSLRAAEEGGAHILVLCDTNGGTLPHEVSAIIREIKRHVKTPLGIHVHNDAECGVANSLAAVAEGVSHVQGTINGYGERCGNANLVSVIPNLELKMGMRCLPEGALSELRDLSRFVSELANRQPWQQQPFVGDSAFAHKGGIHVSAVLKHPDTYEHINPEMVGNHRRVLVSELAGQSNILWKAKEYGIDLEKSTPETRRIIELLKQMEDQGFQFEGAEASFELLIQEALGRKKKNFRLVGFRVIDEKRKEGEAPLSEATIMVEVDGEMEHAAAMGNGPVNALDQALRRALTKFYPKLKEVELLDYKVRVLSSGEGTAATVRVLIESGDHLDRWGTVGVSHNVIEASWQALVDSIDYKLYKDAKQIRGQGIRRKEKGAVS